MFSFIDLKLNSSSNWLVIGAGVQTDVLQVTKSYYNNFVWARRILYLIIDDNFSFNLVYIIFNLRLSVKLLYIGNLCERTPFEYFSFILKPEPIILFYLVCFEVKVKLLWLLDHHLCCHCWRCHCWRLAETFLDIFSSSVSLALCKNFNVAHYSKQYPKQNMKNLFIMTRFSGKTRGITLKAIFFELWPLTDKRWFHMSCWPSVTDKSQNLI